MLDIPVEILVLISTHLKDPDLRSLVATSKSILLRSKGLKDATCVGWFGDDWDCSVGSPPEAMDHVSSAVPVGYTV